MKLMQRYILGELLRVFALLVVVLTVMLVFVGLLREAAEQGLGPDQIIRIQPFRHQRFSVRGKHVDIAS